MNLHLERGTALYVLSLFHFWHQWANKDPIQPLEGTVKVTLNNGFNHGIIDLTLGDQSWDWRQTEIALLPTMYATSLYDPASFLYDTFIINQSISVLSYIKHLYSLIYCLSTLTESWFAWLCYSNRDKFLKSLGWVSPCSSSFAYEASTIRRSWRRGTLSAFDQIAKATRSRIPFYTCWSR